VIEDLHIHSSHLPPASTIRPRWRKHKRHRKARFIPTSNAWLLKAGLKPSGGSLTIIAALSSTNFPPNSTDRLFLTASAISLRSSRHACEYSPFRSHGSLSRSWRSCSSLRKIFLHIAFSRRVELTGSPSKFNLKPEFRTSALSPVSPAPHPIAILLCYGVSVVGGDRLN
jgi:hypothetical protein